MDYKMIVFLTLSNNDWLFVSFISEILPSYFYL